MFTIEIHPSEGGMDAELFANELGNAIGKHANMKVSSNGRIVTAQGRL